MRISDWSSDVCSSDLAVLLDPDCIPDGINDSKKLSEIARARLHDELVGCARVGVGIASVEEIDSINILQASLLAMRRAVDALDHAPVMVLEIGRASWRGRVCPYV